LNFGRIEGMRVKQGEPVWDPPPRVIREVRHPPRSGWLDELGRLKGGRPRV
jgi:hypothetical protein